MRSRRTVLTKFEVSDIDVRVSEQISRALESNHIVYFPRSPVPLPDTQALQFLRSEVAPLLTQGNVSYHARARRLMGLKRANHQTYERTTNVLRQHLHNVTGFLQRVLPRQCEGWTVGKASFRPLQERGRNLKPYDSNELVHVDTGVLGATNGDRILRFFVNINEREDRVWRSQGTIQDVLDLHGIPSGLLDRTGRLQVAIDKGISDHLLSFAVRALSCVSPRARQMDTSPYDRAMRQLHRYMKDSEFFKADQRFPEQIRFPPGSAWMAFTDGVTHASVSGQFALVSTFILRRRSLRDSHFAPYHLLAIRT
jgi:hypothetical protein